MRSHGQLQARTKVAEAELVKLRAKSKLDGKLIEDLSKERAFLNQKLKDRDEELRGKTKLLDVWQFPVQIDILLTSSRMFMTKLSL